MGDEAIKQAIKAGVELVLTAGIDTPTSEEAVQVARKYSIARACVGIHPWNADQYDEESRSRLKALAAHDGVVAISEIGLDYVGRRNREGKYVNEFIDKRIQRAAFEGQLSLARETGLPVLVHDRAPDHEVLDVLEGHGMTGGSAAIHGFSKDQAYAERCVEIGVYLSMGSRAIMSPENEALREAVREMPLEWLLTETDSGNPEGVVAVAEKIAELKGLTKERVGRAATRNLRKLVRL